MDKNKCKCSMCGYEWFQFNDGSHSCAENLKNRLDEVKEIILGTDDQNDTININIAKTHAAALNEIMQVVDL